MRKVVNLASYSINSNDIIDIPNREEIESLKTIEGIPSLEDIQRRSVRLADIVEEAGGDEAIVDGEWWLVPSLERELESRSIQVVNRLKFADSWRGSHDIPVCLSAQGTPLEDFKKVVKNLSKKQAAIDAKILRETADETWKELRNNPESYTSFEKSQMKMSVRNRREFASIAEDRGERYVHFYPGIREDTAQALGLKKVPQWFHQAFDEAASTA